MDHEETTLAHPPSNPIALWAQALGELQLQMTQATFDTWLRDSCCLRCEDDVFVIGVKSGYAKDWLENRLLASVKRTLTRLVGRPSTARFEVIESALSPARPQATTLDAPASMVVDAVPVLEALLDRLVDPDARLAVQHELARLRGDYPVQPASSAQRWCPPDFDPSDINKVKGWFPVPEYANRFWGPFLGRVAWRVWELNRPFDRTGAKEPWTPPHSWSVPELAAYAHCTPQSLTGRNVRCDPAEPGSCTIVARRVAGTPQEMSVRHIEGAFELLEREGVARIEQVGVLRHTRYWISVRTRLPLLSPGQVSRLRSELQVAHDRWVADHGLDPGLWRT